MLNPILARFQNEPTLVSAGSKAWFEACVASAATTLANIESAQDAPSMADDFWFSPTDWRSAYRPYVVKDGVLHIPIKGVLLNDFGYAFGSWATGYQYIQKAFDRGMGDADVRAIAFVIDSPGGMVAGNFDLVDRLYARRGEKPVAAFASEHAYSAAYSLASVADPGRLYVARTGGVGSIGVVTTHIDVSKAVESQGVVVNFIYAGAHKVDGNPYAPLPDDVRARIQERIDTLYSIFVSTVARNRGLDEQAVRNTEAQTFMAAEALSNGLADKIGSLDDALADFSASLNPEQGDEPMADITQADHETALAAARTEATAAGQKEGASAERTRISAILNSEEGKARPTSALAAAMDTDLSAEAACAFLAKLPEEPKAGAAAANPSAGAPKGMFEAAMNGSANPDLTGDGGEGEEMSVSDGIFASVGRTKKSA